MKIRIVEDDQDIARWLVIALNDYDDVQNATTTADFDSLLTPEPWRDINSALIDYHLGSDITGLDILRYLKGEHPHIWRVLLTAMEPDQRMRDYAHRVLTKPASVHDIYQALREGRRGR